MSHVSMNLITDKNKAQQYVNMILNHQAFHVDSYDKKPEYNPFNQDYTRKTMYVTQKQGDYEYLTIRPEISQEETIALSKTYSKEIEKLLQKYPIKSIPQRFPYRYAKRHNIEKATLKQTKNIEKELLQKFPFINIQGLLIIINKRDYKVINSLEQAELLPIRIASTFSHEIIDSQEKIDKNTSLTISSKDFHDLVKCLPGCNNKNLLSSIWPLREPNMENLNVNNLFSTYRYTYSLLTGKANSNMETQIIKALIISQTIKSKSDFVNPQINPYPDFTNISDYRPLKKYNPTLSLFNEQFSHTKNSLTSFKEPTIKTYPQNFETLLKQTDPKEQSVYFNNENFYKIQMDNVYKLTKEG